MRLFCFPHAGGGGAMFRTWRRALGPGVDVVAVHIANRERFTTLRSLVEAVDEQLRPASDGPHAFFGHSFGALVAYRLACRRVSTGASLPHALFISSYALPPPASGFAYLDDHRLAAVLTDLGGLPSSLAQWPILRDQAVAAARHDLRLCATDDDAAEPLPCPIYAFGGHDDPLVSESDLAEWGSRTSGEFSARILPGGHFYLNDGYLNDGYLNDGYLNDGYLNDGYLNDGYLNDGPRLCATLKPILRALNAGGAPC